MARSLALARRRMMLGLTGGAAALYAAACEPVATKTPEPAAKAPATKVQLRFLSPAAHIEEHIKEMVPVWNETHPNVQYGMTLGPKGPTGRRGGWMTSAASSITRFSKHPDEAFRFLIDFTGRDWSVSRGLQRTGSTTLNGRPDVYHDRAFMEDPYTPRDVAEMKAKAMDFTEKEEDCSYTRGVSWNFRDADIWAAQRQTIYKIATGEAPGSQDMVTQLRQLVEPIMELPRPEVKK